MVTRINSGSEQAEKNSAYLAAMYEFLFYAQARRQSALDLPQTEEGLILLGKVYARAADMLAGFGVLKVASENGPVNTMLVLILIVLPHMKELAADPGSPRTLYELSHTYKAQGYSPELDQEITRFLNLWKDGYFQPMNYPHSFAETASSAEDEEESAEEVL